ncbi:MAG: hypothetical protein ACI9TH_000020 [Kiritimatiellia bacterium]|jgi:hypothetical protein
MKMKIILAALWALSLVLVHLMTRDSNQGAELHSAKLQENTAGGVSRVEERLVVREPRSVEKIVVVEREGSSRLSSYDEGRSGTPSSEDLLARLPEALRDGGDTMANNLLVAQMLANLTPENVMQTLAVFEQAENGPLNDHNFRMFMYAWGEIDGQAATKYAFFNEDSKKVHFGGSVAMIGWSSQDPDAAKAFVEGVEDDNRSKGYMMDALVRGWAKTDLNGASNYVGTLDDTDGRRKMVEHLAQERIKREGSGSALAWADTVASGSDDAKYANQVVNEVAFHAARKDPMVARDWVERNLDSEYLSPRIFEEVADEMVGVDPRAAADFLDQHFDDPRVNGKVIAEMTEEWARTDPTATAAWLEQYVGHEKINKEVVHELAGEWADSDPEAALAWVAALESKDLQKKGLASAIDHWSRHDTAAVGEWLNGQTQRGDLYDSAIEVYASRISREAPVAALSWAQQIQDEGMRERTTVRAGQAMYREDPDAVLSWLPTSGLSERAQQAIQKPQDNRQNWRGGRR